MKAWQVLTKWQMQLTTNDNNLYINYDRSISNILINKKRKMNFIISILTIQIIAVLLLLTFNKIDKWK